MDQTEQIRELRAEVRDLRSELHRLDLWRQMLPIRVMEVGIYLALVGLIATILATNPLGGGSAEPVSLEKLSNRPAGVTAA